MDSSGSGDSIPTPPMVSLNHEFDLLNKNLQNIDRTSRQTALKSILDHCRNIRNLSENDSNQIYETFYLALLKCYADRYENVRSLAIEIMTLLLNQLPINSYYIECIVPVIAKRLGQSEIHEDSEEIRLILLEQIAVIVQRYRQSEADYLANVYDDMIDILVKSLRDSYPAAQRECCTIIQSLADATPRFNIRSVNLVDGCIAMLKHRHLANRIAAIQALGVIALHLHGNGESIIKIISSISPLLMDSIPAVRLECGRVGCKWLMDLRDRYSFFERLVPLVLCCLKDDTESIRNEISILWQQCGQQYFIENETELNQIEIVDKLPDCYPLNIQRPSLGCRTIVRRSLRVISIVTQEMQDWKEEVRVHALKFLWQIILHSEKAATAKIIEIFPTLCRCCSDNDHAVQSEAISVANLLGRLLDYSEWIDYALKELKLSKNIGVLMCFTEMYRDATNAGKSKDVSRIAIILSDSTICHNLNQDYQRILLKLVEQLVDLYHSNQSMIALVDHLHLTDNHENYDTKAILYSIIIKVIALSENNDEIKHTGQELLAKLVNGMDNVKSAHGKYLKNVLQTIDGLDLENSERSETILLLHGIIEFCGFQMDYMSEMVNGIQMVMDNGSPNGKIKIFSAICVAMCNWTKNISQPADASEVVLQKFIGDIIEPCLMWKAGRSSESIRSMAISALCCASQGAPQETKHLFSTYAVHFIGLLDDNSVVTRGYTLRCLLNCGPIKVDSLKSVAFGVLARLDDPSAEVRQYAAQVIGLLELDEIGENDVEIWGNSVTHLMERLILHLDDPEIKLQSLLLGSIESIAKRYPNIFNEAISTVPKSYHYWKVLQSIQIKIK